MDYLVVTLFKLQLTHIALVAVMFLALSPGNVMEDQMSMITVISVGATLSSMLFAQEECQDRLTQQLTFSDWVGRRV